LVVSRVKGSEEERTWPGRIFEREDLSYPEAMDHFIAARRAKEALAPADAVGAQAPGDRKAQRQALRSASWRLQLAREEERERRRLSDRAWKVLEEEQRAALPARAAPERPRGLPTRARLDRGWRAHWAQRHQELARRREADAGWRRERGQIRQEAHALGAEVVSAWIAVLVLVDNCTRRSRGLPLFAVGAHVTAELVAEALAALLPKRLAYLIADRGAHFTAAVIKDLEKGRGFVRVPLARHRPRSNGIAERFIETLKAWLADKEWQAAEELAVLLVEFRDYYNDRPHQGSELAGLSPNQYAARLGVI
jgi:transposase InsO family protein